MSCWAACSPKRAVLQFNNWCLPTSAPHNARPPPRQSPQHPGEGRRPAARGKAELHVQTERGGPAEHTSLPTSPRSTPRLGHRTVPARVTRPGPLPPGPSALSQTKLPSCTVPSHSFHIQTVSRCRETFGDESGWISS